MKTLLSTSLGTAAGLLCLTLVGCYAVDGPAPKAEKSVKKKLAKNVYLETLANGDRRVLVEALICRRQDQLEQLLCTKQTKEHESILTADVDARAVHAALLAARATPGSPVQYDPYRPAHGSKIRVRVQYQDKDGKTVTVPAQHWIRNMKTNKEMEYDWVFAGSKLFPPDQPGGQPYYAANGGDVICVANFDTAMLDLPVELPKDNSALIFEAWTDRIPPLETEVTVILDVMPEQEKEGSKKQ